MNGVYVCVHVFIFALSIHNPFIVHWWTCVLLSCVPAGLFILDNTEDLWKIKFMQPSRFISWLVYYEYLFFMWQINQLFQNPASAVVFERLHSLLTQVWVCFASLCFHSYSSVAHRCRPGFNWGKASAIVFYKLYFYGFSNGHFCFAIWVRVT